MIKITLNQIAAQNPCSSGWAKILHARGKINDSQLTEFLEDGGVPESYSKLADDEEFPLAIALKSNGFDDVKWSLRCLPDDFRLWRKYAVWCARQVQHLMTDQSSINALDVAWRHSDGLATDEELASARRDADAAADAYASASSYADASAASAAYAYAYASASAYAYASAYAAAASADAYASAYAAAAAASADAYASAYAAAAAAAGAEARKKQEAKLLQILEAGHWVDDK
jgi:hypothetical protein